MEWYQHFGRGWPRSHKICLKALTPNCLLLCIDFWLCRIKIYRKDASFTFRVSNRSAGMISYRFPGDIFTKIQQNLQFYRHLPGRVTNPGITLILSTQAIAQLKDIYWGLTGPISINPGLLQDVLLVHCEVQEFWVSQKISRLCWFPGFPGELDTLTFHTRRAVQSVIADLLVNRCYRQYGLLADRRQYQTVPNVHGLQTGLRPSLRHEAETLSSSPKWDPHAVLVNTSTAASSSLIHGSIAVAGANCRRAESCAAGVDCRRVCIGAFRQRWKQLRLVWTAAKNTIGASTPTPCPATPQIQHIQHAIWVSQLTQASFIPASIPTRIISVTCSLNRFDITIHL